MTKTNKTQENNTKEKLISTFWDLYSKFPIEKITVSQVTELSGYHRNTFYYYFDDIYNILDYIEDKIMEEIFDNTFYIDNKGELKLNSEELVKIYNKYSSYLLVLSDNEKNLTFQNKLYNNFKNKYKDIIYYSKDNMINDLIFEYKHVGFISTILYYFRSGSKLSLEKAIDILYKLSEGTYKIKQKK